MKAAERWVHKGPRELKPGVLAHTGGSELASGRDATRAQSRRTTGISLLRRGGEREEKDTPARGAFWGWRTRPETRVVPGPLASKGVACGGLGVRKPCRVLAEEPLVRVVFSDHSGSRGDWT